MRNVIFSSVKRRICSRAAVIAATALSCFFAGLWILSFWYCGFVRWRQPGDSDLVRSTITIGVRANFCMLSFDRNYDNRTPVGTSAEVWSYSELDADLRSRLAHSPAWIARLEERCDSSGCIVAAEDYHYSGFTIGFPPVVILFVLVLPLCLRLTTR